MKTHTSQFKNTIKEFGREIDSKITYTINNEEIELGSEELNSITPHYEGAILKSVMKQLDIDSNVEIPLGTILRYQFGVKVGNEYEYIDYGNYVVYSVEKQEDTYSYKITCYDKMLYAMKDYENSNITFPIAIKDYLEAICEKVGLEYEGSQFANSDKVIDNELYLDNEGRSLEYTFRDVLDEIAQVSGGTICINNEDKLEVRYIHDVGELQTLTGSSLTLETDDAIKLDSFELEGKTTQETRSGKNLLNIPSEYVLTGAQWINLALEPGTYTLSTSNITSTANKFLFLVRFPNSTYNKYIYLTTTSLYETFTITDTSNQVTIYSSDGYNSSQSVTTTFSDMMLEKSATQTEYEQYGVQPSPDYPSELVSVGYENLFDEDSNEIYLNGRLNTVGDVYGEYNYFISPYIPIKANTIYTKNSPIADAYHRVCFYSNNDVASFISRSESNSFTTPSNAKYLRFCGKDSEIDNAQLVESTQAHSYIPYGKYGIEVKTTDEDNNTNTYLYTLDNPLRSIGNYKDLLYIKNGMLYVDRKIGSIVLDGSENWSLQSINSYGIANFGLLQVGEHTETSYAISNYFKNQKSFISQTQDNGVFNNLNYIYIRLNQNIANTVASFKTWLSAHNTEVQYILAEPYTEELGSVDMPSTYEGITYIDTPNTMNVSYISEFEEIDEEYLKDVNVNFGEKFGAVNTIVLSRGGDGDKIGLSIPSNLADEDKIAIQITDNQIMNGNNRADFMQPILNQLYGLEYYINDFSSTGICYLDLCDRYRIKIGDNSYKCIMFNDEVDITQGLEELIYTDMQEENEQEYKYIGSTDRGITQANIIANKAEATISSFTQQLDETNNRLNSVEVKQTATDETINIISTNIDANGNITEVTTTTGFTFNADGMTIADNQTNFSALHRNTGTYYYDGDTIVGQYTKDGSKQKDLELFGVYYYGKNYLPDDPMFVAQLYTDENGEEAFGHFYNRGD